MINMQKMNKKQAGFTLIELVMVIVILGILSAFALPRFADLTGDARTASIEGLAGALKSGAAIAHSQWVADGNNAATVTLEGAPIAMTAGYPDAAANGISTAVNLDTNDYTPDTTVANTITYTIEGYESGGSPVANCFVSYEEAVAADPGPPVVSASLYVVNVETSGC